MSIRSMSLERKLPLLVIAVLVATLVTAIGLAYREVRESGKVASTERIKTLARQLASLSTASTGTRAKLLREVAESPAVREAVSTLDPASVHDPRLPAAAAALRQLIVPADSAVAIELWSASGRLVLSVGDTPENPATQNDARRAFSIPGNRIAQTTMPTDGGVHFLPLFEGGDNRVYYWMTVPVINRGVPVGWIAEQRRIMSRPGSDQRINSLLGDNAAAYFRNDSDPFWSTIGGIPAAQPIAAPALPTPAIGVSAGVSSYTRVKHGSVLATALPIEGTPWWVVVEIDHSAMLAGARSLLLKFVLFSLPLLLAAAATSWWLIRRALRPLVDLTNAATLMAHGDYSARVEVAHEDEVGRLGTSFNRMAGEVDAAHARLASQVEEAQRLADELEQARNTAVTASKAKSNFLATMSHEIRTPINAIIGYADILDLGIPGPLTPKQHENVSRIRTSSSHLLALVNDVLDLSRIESGTMQLSNARIDTRSSIEAAVALVEPQATAKRIRIFVQADDERSATCVGDERGVHQALVNLLSNAVKFTNADGQIHIAATLSNPPAACTNFDPRSEYVAISVADTGIGIDEAQIARLFQPFTQLEAEDGNPYTRQASGAGLGLSISRHLARMMGGDITVTSVPQKGSTFTLWLPCQSTGATASPDGPAATTLDHRHVSRQATS